MGTCIGEMMSVRAAVPSAGRSSEGNETIGIKCRMQCARISSVLGRTELQALVSRVHTDRS